MSQRRSRAFALLDFQDDPGGFFQHPRNQSLLDRLVETQSGTPLNLGKPGLKFVIQNDVDAIESEVEAVFRA